MNNWSFRAVKRSLAAFVFLETLIVLAPVAMAGMQATTTPTASSCWTAEQEQGQANGFMTWTSPPAMVIDSANAYVATLETSAGSIVIELFAVEAPVTV